MELSNANTARVLGVYLVSLIADQAATVGIGLLLDPFSSTLALSVFIPSYYAMYRLAWRFALLVADKEPAAEAETAGGSERSGAKLLAVLLVPAVLAFDLSE
jgi:hypothetical protein